MTNQLIRGWKAVDTNVYLSPNVKSSVTLLGKWDRQRYSKVCSARVTYLAYQGDEHQAGASTGVKLSKAKDEEWWNEFKLPGSPEPAKRDSNPWASRSPRWINFAFLGNGSRQRALHTLSTNVGERKAVVFDMKRNRMVGGRDPMARFSNS